MGAKSTIIITRSKAVNFIMSNLCHLDNQAISQILEEVNDAIRGGDDHLGFHNFRVREVEYNGDNEYSLIQE